MSKYSQIAALATLHAERFFAHRDQCAEVAVLVLNRFALYLEAPEGTLHFLELDQDLKLTRVRTHDPKMEQGEDGYWYFGLQVHFAEPARRGFSDSFLRFGLKIEGETGSVKVDTPLKFNLNAPESLEPMFEEIVRSYEEYYSAASGSLPTSIGFIRPGE